MMRIVCQDVVRAAEKLGVVSDELKREEAALAIQQHKVATVSESLEQRETRYKDAGTLEFHASRGNPYSHRYIVFAVLDETKQIVQLCDKKREVGED